MKRILFTSILFCATSVFAQEHSSSTIPVLQEVVTQQKEEISVLQQKLSIQQNIINKQKNTLDILSVKVDNQERRIDSLKMATENNDQNIQSTENDLSVKIQETEVTTKNEISKLDKDVTQNRIYWIIGTFVTLLLGGIIYLLLGKRIRTSKTDVETQIKHTKKTLEEESIRLDSRLIEMLETQLKLKQEERQTASVSSNNNIDHSLALKVADEIVRMQKNISKIDGATKGLKPLIKGIERIQANFASNGYEMINLLNMDYDERMTIDVINFITDENLPEGRKIITAVIKPQVNYNGILIQRAQVDVSQN